MTRSGVFEAPCVDFGIVERHLPLNDSFRVRPPGGRRTFPAAGLLVLGLMGSAIHASAEPPRVGSLGVRNGASFGFARAGGGIAPGSIFVIFGAGMGPEAALQGTIPYPDSLPDDAMGTRVEFRSLESGTSVAAYLLYTSASQLMGILPSETPLGRAEVSVTYQGETSRPQEVNILPRAVGIFTQSMNGQGPGVIQNVDSASDQPLNQLTRPALPGQYIVLWATGLGAITGPDNVEPPVGNVGDEVEVEVAGQRLQASYAGRAPGFPGVDQINVRLPDGEALPDSCYVTLQVWTGDRPSQPVVFSAAATPGPCQNPFGLSPETLADLDAGGRVALGQFRISRFLQQLAPQPWFDPAASFGVASGGFFSVDAGDLAVFSPSWGLDQPQEELGCQVTPLDPPNVIIFGSFDSEEFVPVPESRILQLDAGEALELSGPGEKQQELQRLHAGDSVLVFDYTTQRPNTDGSCCIDTLPGEYFESGEWTLEGTGGADVGAFQTAMQLPPFPEINVPQTVNREQDLELTWSPDGYGQSDQISIGIGSPTQIEVDGQIQTVTTAQVRCGALASSGRLTVPASLMRETLTVSGERKGSWFVSVIRPESDTALFSAPGIDYGVLLFTFGDFRSVNIE